jgi:Protein of unknown function (DUF3638)
VTLKPLTNQTFELLVSRLSGLANRPIFYVPISRSLSVNASLIGQSEVSMKDVLPSVEFWLSSQSMYFL